MRNLPLILVSLILAVLLGISGMVSANLWRELRVERQASADLRARSADPAMATSAAASTLQSSGTVPSCATPVTQTQPDTPESSAATLTPEEFNSRIRAVCANTRYAIHGIPSELELLKNADFRTARLTQIRVTEATLNPGLAEALGLSEKEASQIFGLMAESQLDSMIELMQLPKSSVVGSGLADASRRQAASQEASLRSLIGSARYTQLQQYWRDVRPALTQVADFGRTLASAGKPLTDSQSRSLSAAVLAEQQSQMREAATRRVNSNQNSLSSAQSLTESQTRQEENSRRILDVAALHLNPAQLEILRAQTEEQNASRRNAIKEALSP